MVGTLYGDMVETGVGIWPSMAAVLLFAVASVPPTCFCAFIVLLGTTALLLFHAIASSYAWLWQVLEVGFRPIRFSRSNISCWPRLCENP